MKDEDVRETVLGPGLAFQAVLEMGVPDSVDGPELPERIQHQVLRIADTDRRLFEPGLPGTCSRHHASPPSSIPQEQVEQSPRNQNLKEPLR